MRDPYKIMVWGPGRMGKVCIWQTIEKPELELVGVRAYSDGKVGIDAGELLGLDAIGVKISNNIEALLDIECDAILYTAHDEGTYHTDDEILQLLAAGKNVITPLPYQNAHLFREPEFVEKLNAACAKGGTVFHAGGVDPDWMSDRILLGLTGACADVKSVKLQEHWDCSLAEEGPLRYVGFGRVPEDAEKITITQTIAANFTRTVVYTAEKVMKVKYDRVVETHDYIPTPVDIHKPFFIAAGTVGRIVHRMQGFVDAIGPDALFTIEYHWFIGEGMLPEGISPGQYYVATIEGCPSMKMSLDLKVSNKNNDRAYKIGNMELEPSYVATIIPCLQALPFVCEASPGILPSFGPSLNWVKDLRDSV